jgi:hypothetical protein
VISPLSFKGAISRPAYAATSLAVFSLQYAFAWMVLLFKGWTGSLPLEFWLVPARVVVERTASGPPWIMMLGLALMLLVNWALIALAFRRAQTTDFDDGWVLLMALPFVQFMLVIGLALMPHAQRDSAPHEPAIGNSSRAMALGLLTGVALCLAAVALSTLVFGIYGYGLFFFSPVVIGATVAILANRDVELGLRKTTGLVMAALGLGGLALMAFAFEGLICIVFASPLIAFAGFLGGLIGKEIADNRRSRRGGTAVRSILLLPLVLGAEALFPPSTDFESVESIDIAATPAAVWESIVHMNPIPDAPAAPFRWGLAYPLRGEINGIGIGAVRRGVFSTGVAYERVTVWEPEHRLSFDVLSDPPSMRELSPYEHVNAPHTRAYFRTRDARFTIESLQEGRTRLTLATHHDLDLEPALYWLPFAHWAIHANKVRVLRHFRQQAERR